jgi:hypothetical protein
MGNRGILHDADKQISKQWAHKAWVACLTTYKNVQRIPFSVGSYSELFFLDEAVALSAGHRPCTRCQRVRSNEFKDAWLRGNSELLTHLNTIKLSDIDAVLHQQRVNASKEKQSFDAIVSTLPMGSFFTFKEQALVVLAKNKYAVWSFDGYFTLEPVPYSQEVKVLTPLSLVNAFKAGFLPNFHASAGKL